MRPRELPVALPRARCDNRWMRGPEVRDSAHACSRIGCSRPNNIRVVANRGGGRWPPATRWSTGIQGSILMQGALRCVLARVLARGVDQSNHSIPQSSSVVTAGRGVELSWIQQPPPNGTERCSHHRTRRIEHLGTEEGQSPGERDEDVRLHIKVGGRMLNRRGVHVDRQRVKTTWTPGYEQPTSLLKTHWRIDFLSGDGIHTPKAAIPFRSGHNTGYTGNFPPFRCSQGAARETRCGLSSGRSPSPTAPGQGTNVLEAAFANRYSAISDLPICESQTAVNCV